MERTSAPPQSVHKLDGVRSISRALDVLRCFRSDGGPLRPAEIARRIETPSSTTHRLITILVDTGFLEFVGPGYRLGPSVVELGLLARHERGLHLVSPELEYLHELTGATVDLAIRSGGCALLVAGGSVRSATGMGLLRPLHSTAMGKVLLAWDRSRAGAPSLPDPSAEMKASTERTIVDPSRLYDELMRVRNAGYALNDEESEVGIRSVAVPVLDRGETARFALAVRGTTDAIPYDRIQWTVERANSCARALQVLLLGPDDR